MYVPNKRSKSLIIEGARTKEYETAIMRLSDRGLIHKGSRVNTAGIPLRAYEDLKAFKLFVVDVGLLGCMAGLRQRTLLDGNDLFVEFKGALTEQYVCQQLKTIENLDVYYYTNDRGSCEVDFVVDTGEQIVPVEVKAEVNLRAKSLKTYQKKFSPEISVRASMSDYKAVTQPTELIRHCCQQLIVSMLSGKQLGILQPMGCNQPEAADKQRRNLGFLPLTSCHQRYATGKSADRVPKQRSYPPDGVMLQLVTVPHSWESLLLTGMSWKAAH